MPYKSGPARSPRTGGRIDLRDTMGGMEVLFVAALIAGVVLFVVAAVRSYLRMVEDAWRTAAEMVGLIYRSRGMGKSRSIGGQLDGKRVEVDTYTQGAGNSSTTYTRYRVYFPEQLDLGLKLKRQGFFAGVTTLFGAQDIRVGDSAFDEDVIVKGADPRRVVEFLTPSRRLRILRLFQTFRDCEIDDRGVTWSRRGVEKDANQLAGCVSRLSTAVGRLADDGETGRSIDQALEAQREGRLDDALRFVQKQTPARESVKDPDARLLEGQILHTGGRHEQAAAVLERAHRENPADEELAAWARQASGASMPPPAGAQPTVEPATAGSEPQPPTAVDDAEVTAPVEGGALELAAVCAALFAPSAMSLETNRLFEERYKGRTVRWSGTVRRVGSYYVDLVFGTNPGTRLVLELLEVSGGAFGRTVQAIVQLPEQALDELQSRIGERITVEGRLVGCDALVRNLYLAEARMLDAGGR